MNARVDPDAGLVEFITHRARHSSDRRLVANALIGILISVAAALWRPFAWVPLLCAALCFAMFGLWGIADRELIDHPDGEARSTMLRVLRMAAALFGMAAGAGLMLSVLALTLGTWIS